MIARAILVVHRYLGVVVGLLMLLWCLSGFVMMYHGYPQLTPAERLRGLEPLRWGPVPGGSALALPQQRSLSLPDDMRLSGFTIEMLAGRPVLQFSEEDGSRRALDLQTGAVLDDFSDGTAVAVAAAYAAGHGIVGRPQELGLIDDDQWTVEDAARRGPVYHLRFDDTAGTEIYVAARTGWVVQVTTRSARFWAWLGAVPHWLYPVILRRNALLWDQVVVWSSLVGTFLTATGLYVGITHLRPGAGRWSPYRGWSYWHHILGLVFGLLALTWVASGLFTMNPWGFLDTPVASIGRARVAGMIRGADLKRFLAVAPALAGGQVAQLQAVPLNGRLFVEVVGRDGTSRRVNVEGVQEPLTQAEVRQSLQAASPVPIASLTRLDREDEYYYSRYEAPAVLPVYRAELDDGQGTVFYLDCRTGRVLDVLDGTARRSRWLMTGLHDFDFTAGLRRRPVWDLVVLVLLAGASAVSGTGAWLAVRRVGRDVRYLRRRRGLQ